MSNWLSQVKARLMAATPDSRELLLAARQALKSRKQLDASNWTDGERCTFELGYRRGVIDTHTDLDKAIYIIECYERALDHYSKLQDWKMLSVPAIDALTEAEAIKGEG